MTVSRVVNGSAGVLPETRERVERTIAELGYVPNAAARSLAGGGQSKIALLHDNPSAAYLSEFLVGCLDEASALDLQVIVEQHASGGTAADIVQLLARHRADAVLLPPPLCDDGDLLAALRQAGLPVAQVATAAPAEFAHAFAIDDEAAAYAITRRLAGQGHRRIGFVAGAANQTASALRLAGFRRALAESGLPDEPEFVAAGDFGYRSGLDAAERLLSLARRPTAIFASNDDMAAAVLATAHRHRLDVPGDLSVCGFDDTPIATTVWPELTTIRQPIRDMARMATRALARAVRGRGAARPQHEQLPFALVERASDGSPRDV